MTARRAPSLLACLLLAGCATSPGGDATGFPARLAGLGTEPFWNIAVEGSTLRYTSADAPAPRAASVTRRVTKGTLELAGTFSGQPLSAQIRRERCSDGMSDRTYPLAVALTIEGRQLAGCAYAADNPPPPK